MLIGCSGEKIPEDQIGRDVFISIFNKDSIVSSVDFETIDFESLYIFDPYYPQDLIEDTLGASVSGIDLEKHNRNEDNSLVIMKGKDQKLTYFYVPVTEIDFSSLDKTKFNHDEMYFRIEKSPTENRKIVVKSY
jgi:hypothetical protein